MTDLLLTNAKVLDVRAGRSAKRRADLDPEREDRGHWRWAASRRRRHN